MAAQKKEKRPQYVSFKGAFKYPKLTEPDLGTDEYPKPDGEYSLRLVGDPNDPDVKAFIAKFGPLHEQAVDEGKAASKELDVKTRKRLEKDNGKGLIKINDFYSEVYDKDTEEPTGEIEFKFAMKASGEFKKGPKAGKTWHRKPAIFDAKGRPMKNPPAIWSGTVGRVSFNAAPYFVKGNGMAGIKFYLNAVRIIDLVSEGERSASAYGFDGEEDGYAYEPSIDNDEYADKPADKSDAGEADDNNPDF